jgi:hypothetical protein
MVDGGGITVWAVALDSKLSRGRRIDLIVDSGPYVANVLDLRTFDRNLGFRKFYDNCAL